MKYAIPQVAAVLLVCSGVLWGASANLITIDASRASVSAVEAPFMSGTSPSGHTIAINNLYLLRDGQPWLPVMGEFHYSRYPEKYWEEELLKMKAGGIQIVATYVFWIHHEEIEGEFEWSGQRNLRHFIELARQHGLYVWLRLGPYAHGEVRNGGLPDWILKQCRDRTNDPAYLKYVARYFHQIGEQVRGLLWKDGGPIIGLQLENEYFKRGPEAGAAHILKLKRLAHEAGIEAPIYTVTGWDDPEFPPGEVVPVFGGYPDNFWESALEELPPNGLYQFDFGSVRDLQGAHAATSTKQTYPLLMAEAGGGMTAAYHRRPRIDADDIGAIALTRLGSGANLYGYYMFQGGANPQGKLTSLQESEATDHVYDLPVRNYDFQAPLGQFGQVRDSFRITKNLHLFLNDFGTQLARMQVVRPSVVPKDTSDLSTPRVAARVAGTHAFLFFNNYQRGYPLLAHKNVQFAVKFASELITLPSIQITIPSNTYFIWPVNLPLEGTLLKFATAQLVTKIRSRSEDYYVFSKVPGIETEFAFDRRSLASIKASGGDIRNVGGVTYVRGIKPGLEMAMSFRSTTGRTGKVILLSAEEARDIWKTSLSGGEHLFLSSADLFVADNEVHLRSRKRGGFSLAVFPDLPLRAVTSSDALTKTKKGIFSVYKLTVPQKAVDVQWKKIRNAEPSKPAVRGKFNAIAPTDADFEGAATWQILIAQGALDAFSDVFLRIEYLGDVARLYSQQELLMDDFYNGSTFEIGLKRYRSQVDSGPLTLKLMPLRKDANIYLPPGAWPHFPTTSETADLVRVTLQPEYEVIFAPIGKTSNEKRSARGCLSDE